MKYCQHLHKTRKLSITHWKGEENPADGLTKSSKPLSLWTNLVEAVGLVPGPKRTGIQLDPQSFESDSTREQCGFGYLSGSALVASKKGISS